MNILVSDISSYKAVVIAKYIRKNYKNINIYSYDNRLFTRYLHTKYTHRNFVIKPNQDGEILPLLKIAELINQQKIDIFFPVHSTYIDLLLSNRTLFGNTLSYMGSYDSYKILNDKHNIDKLARRLKIKRPKKYRNIKEAKVKCVIKPRLSSPSKKVRYVFNEQQLDTLTEAIVKSDEYIIQEYIQGVGVGYSVFANQGEIIRGYGHRRLAEYPITGGASVYRETFENSEMRSITREILKATKWSGFAMFEFKLTPDNEIYFLEVNPRIWGSINQGLQNGTNFFSPLLGDISESTFGTARETKTFLSPVVFLALVMYCFRGQLRPISSFIKNFFMNKCDIAFIDDYKGWLSVVLRQILRR